MKDETCLPVYLFTYPLIYFTIPDRLISSNNA
jgi:hypothetical protein